MAEVGLFKRLGNLWKGFLSIWISDVEKEHPEIAYEKVDTVRGMDIVFVTTAKTDKEAKALLKGFKLPFVN